MTAAAISAACLVALFVGVPLWAIAAHLLDVKASLAQVAGALSAQNRHYGVGAADPPPEEATP